MFCSSGQELLQRWQVPGLFCRKLRELLQHGTLPRLSARGGYRHSDQRISRGPEQHRPDPQNYARDPLHRRAPRCMIWEGSRLLVSLL